MSVPLAETRELPAAAGPDAAALLLAAHVAVVHRRTRQDQVRVGYRPRRGRDTVLTIDLTGDPTFAGLHRQVAAALADPPAEKPGEQIDLRMRPGGPADGYAGGYTVTAAADAPETFPEALDKQVRLLLAAGGRDPGRPLSALPMADAADAAGLLRWGRYGEPAEPAEPAEGPAECVHTMVERQAARAPDAVAVSCGDRTLTYRDLDARADRLAAALAARGAGPGQVVGVLAERSPELVVALLAVLKSGAAYLCLETDAPAERAGRLLGDAGVTTVVTHGDLAWTPPPDLHLIPAGGPHPAPPAAAAGRPGARPARPGDLAYVSYTSGSTGVPKGVGVPHAAVARLVRDPDWADFTDGDTFLQLAPVAFDASTLEIWAPLTTGARLAIHPPGRVDIDALARTLRAERVTVLWLTAGLFHQMVAARLDALGGLRHLIAGGDVIAGGAVGDLLARHPHLTFTNGYGPTENTTFTTCWTTRTAPAGPVPIGRPIRGTRVAILDSALRPVPAGVPGELYAAGAGLARCYLGAPATTAERFVPDPLAARPGARMYRTGDLASWRPDGTIEFLGRADRQIKIHGYRVEPGEVEAALLADPAISAALVIAEPDGAGGTRLAAFATPEDTRVDPAELANELRGRLLRRLPPYLVPARLLVVHQLPLNRNGKIDRSVFESTGRAPRAVGNPYQAPRTTLESFLAELWAAALGIEPVGVEDDFFELGGHSLIAGELLGRVQQEFGVEIPAREFYLRPTVTELAEAVGDLLTAAAPVTSR
jgi:amino acid adenylation domain-containing protein